MLFAAELQQNTIGSPLLWAQGVVVCHLSLRTLLLKYECAPPTSSHPSRSHPFSPSLPRPPSSPFLEPAWFFTVRECARWTRRAARSCTTWKIRSTSLSSPHCRAAHTTTLSLGWPLPFARSALLLPPPPPLSPSGGNTFYYPPWLQNASAAISSIELESNELVSPLLSCFLTVHFFLWCMYICC